MKRIILVIVAVVLLGGAYVAYPKVDRYLQMQEQESVQKPPAEGGSFSSSVNIPSSSSKASLSSIPSVPASSRPSGQGVNWNVPFTSQAPLLNWDAVHQEACEEASILMVLSYFNGSTFASGEDANNKIQHILDLNEELGFPIDLTSEQVVEVVKHEEPALSAVILDNPTKEDIIDALDQGALVIVPAAGRMLGNPYFRSPGPIYHMLVLRGYTADGQYVITNDPGTKNGKEFVYRWQVLLDAIHDWNQGNEITEGASRVVVVSAR